MIFNSLNFLFVFLPIVFFLYYISAVPNVLVYPIINSYKSEKYQKVIVGTSIIDSLCDLPLMTKLGISALTNAGSNYKMFYELLDKYLKLHPETNEVVIELSYAFLLEEWFVENQKHIQDNSNEYFKHMLFLLFSLDSTWKNIDKLTSKKIRIDSLGKFGNFVVRPFYSPILYKYDDGQSYNDYFNDIKEIANLLKEKNIKCTFVIPPVHANMLSDLYLNETSRVAMDAIKKFIVYELNEKVYDMSLINKYTSLSLFGRKNYIFLDCTHSNTTFWFTRFYQMLFDEENANRELFVLLDKDNIESVIKEQKVLIENYIKTHKYEIEFYFKNKAFPKAVSYTFLDFRNYEQSYSFLKEEVEYKEKLLSEINNKL